MFVEGIFDHLMAGEEDELGFLGDQAILMCRMLLRRLMELHLKMLQVGLTGANNSSSLPLSRLQ